MFRPIALTPLQTRNTVRPFLTEIGKKKLISLFQITSENSEKKFP